MNKKKLVAGLLASASVLGVCLSGGTAFAANVSDQDSQVGIGFGEHIIGKPGELEVKWLPRELDFGSGHKPDAAQAVDYDAKGAAKKYVVVSDAREDIDRVAWTLTAKLSDLSDGGNSLAGVSLNFDSTLMGYAGDQAPEDPSSVIAPGSRTAVVPSSVSLTPNAVTKVMHDNGGGTASYLGQSAVEMSNIKLKVLGGSALQNKTYTGTVTWSLDDTILP